MVPYPSTLYSSIEIISKFILVVAIEFATEKSSLRKSASSIPSNIAEGCGREGEKEFARFLSIAAGSASETEYQLLLAKDLGYMEPDIYNRLNQQVNDVKRMLNSFIQKQTANS